MSIVSWLSVAGLTSGNAVAQSSGWQITVNSNADTVAPDEVVTLREAIAIANGALPLSELTQAENALVLPSSEPTRIGFKLPPGQTKIEIEEELPAIAVPGITLDGTTQPGYDRAQLDAAIPEIPTPIIAITPAPEREIPRGLTLVADDTTLRGLAIYGFTTSSDPTQVRDYVDLITPGRVTAKTPPANIFISHANPPEIRILRGIPEGDFSFDNENDRPPQNIVIEDNELGASGMRSAFGVYVFDGIKTTIRHNRITHHDGSGIITSVRANNLMIQENIIENNGFAGMPDAIRLEGTLEGTAITGNQIRNNGGSAIYVFKPDGAVEIRDNAIADNGQRYQRGAIVLTGRGHQVSDNQIANQPGPGVVVAVFPDGDRVTINRNQFSNLQGLDIDLVAQMGTGVQDYQSGDGRNPLLGIESLVPASNSRFPTLNEGTIIPRFTGNSYFTHQRRRQIANFGINAPQFVSREFFLTPSGNVTVMGKAEPLAEIEIYRLRENPDGVGSASIPIAQTVVNEIGEFRVILEELRPGDRLSATATHPDYGTSESAIASEILALPTTNRPGGSQL